MLRRCSVDVESPCWVADGVTRQNWSSNLCSLEGLKLIAVETVMMYQPLISWSRISGKRCNAGFIVCL